MKAIYVSHNGVGSALVRSQVLPYLRRLGARGFDIHLITYERGRVVFPDGEFPRERWKPLPAHPGSHLGAKIVDVLRGATALARRASGAQIIHARSYVPGMAAWLAGRITGTPFLFDMRGFLPEEYVDAGHWRADEPRHRVLQAAEQLLLRDGAEIVVLTHAAASRLRREARYARSVRDKEITVIPCAVELDRFKPATRRAATPTLVYSGSVGMWYLLDEMIQVFARARERVPGMRFLILNRHERGMIEAACAQHRLDGGEIELRASDFSEMPSHLAGAHAAIALLRQAPSKIGSSPIKVAEYLACGLPVVVNAGLGDTDELVERYAAGYVMRSYGREAIEVAGEALCGLMADEKARLKARALAEAEYDAEAAADTYATVYARLGSVPRRGP